MPTTIERASEAQFDESAAAYRPYGAAAELMKYRGREVLLAGPAGTGKSRAALEKLSFVAYNKPIRAAIVRKVRKSLTQAALVTFEQKVLPKPSGVRFWTEDQEYRYPGGAVIALAGLDDPEKVKSTEFDMIYVQEATELDEMDWELLVSRLRNGVLSYQQLIADCNPADPYHWLKQRCDIGKCLLLECKHEDNPLLYDHAAKKFTEFGQQYLHTLDTLTGYLHKRLRLGLWVAPEGMFFTEWNPEVHVCDPFEIPEHWPRWTSVDYGFAAPFCCLWFARDPEGERPIYVYRERYAAGLRDEEQAELVRLASEGERIVANVLDPSMFNARTEANRPSIAQVYADGGVWPITPGMNNRRTGWAVVRRALGPPPRLRIFRNTCPNLERTLPAMVHDPLDPEDVADKLHNSKTEDHAPDALRYGLAIDAQRDDDTPAEVQWG
jgi:PBSX family phage terminase large subunit